MGEQLSCPCHNEQEMISEQHMDIFLAVREGNLAEARLIISSYPMKVNARDEVISHSSNVLWIVMLVDGQEMKTPLHKAANKNNVEMAQLLLAAGADVNAKNKVTSLGPLLEKLLHTLVEQKLSLRASTLTRVCRAK